MDGLPKSLEHLNSLNVSVTSYEDAVEIVSGAAPIYTQEELDALPADAIGNDVVCGVVFNEQGQVLVGVRREGKDYANSLEFPGGRVEEGETHEQALQREFEEEVGITVVGGITPIYDQRVNGSSKPQHIYFYRVKDYFGQPYGVEGQEVFWLNVDEVDYTRFPPATQLLIQKYILSQDYLSELYEG